MWSGTYMAVWNWLSQHFCSTLPILPLSTYYYMAAAVSLWQNGPWKCQPTTTRPGRRTSCLLPVCATTTTLWRQSRELAETEIKVSAFQNLLRPSGAWPAKYLPVFNGWCCWWYIGYAEHWRRDNNFSRLTDRVSQSFWHPQTHFHYARQIEHAKTKGIDKFIQDLNKLAEDCKYGKLKDKLIRDRVVVGVLADDLSNDLQVRPHSGWGNATQSPGRGQRTTSPVQHSQCRVGLAKEGAKPRSSSPTPPPQNP